MDKPKNVQLSGKSLKEVIPYNYISNDFKVAKWS